MKRLLLAAALVLASLTGHAMAQKTLVIAIAADPTGLDPEAGPFTTNLAMVWNGVVSPTAVSKFKKDFRNHPVGTGPFIFKEYRQGDQVILDANPNYWGGKPMVDRIVFKVIPDAQAALLAIKRGDVHILADVSTQTVPAVRSDTNLVVLSQPGLAVSG